MTAPAQGARRRAREAAFRVAFQADVAGDSYAFAWQLRREDEPQRAIRRANSSSRQIVHLAR